MPCRDYWTDGDLSLTEKDELKERLDVATRVACKAMTILSELNKVPSLDFKMDYEMMDWFADHQEADRQEQERLAEEKAREEKRQRLVNKVTKYFTEDEMEALRELDII